MRVRVVRPHENVVIDLRERKDRNILIRFLPQPVFRKRPDFVAPRKTERVKWCAIHVDAKPAVERIVELLRSGVVDATVSDNSTRIVPVLASDGPILEKAVNVGWSVVHVTAAVEVASEQENRNKPEAKPRMGWVRGSAWLGQLFSNSPVAPLQERSGSLLGLGRDAQQMECLAVTPTLEILVDQPVEH